MTHVQIFCHQLTESEYADEQNTHMLATVTSRSASNLLFLLSVIFNLNVPTNLHLCLDFISRHVKRQRGLICLRKSRIIVAKNRNNHLRATERHMPYGITVSLATRPTQVNAPALKMCVEFYCSSRPIYV